MFLGETFNFPQSFKGTDVSYLENVIVLNQIIEGRKEGCQLLSWYILYFQAQILSHCGLFFSMAVTNNLV